MPDRIAPFMLFTAALVCFASTTVSLAADPFASGPHPVEAKLIANVDAIVPGQAFWIGLHFKMKPHWHTYWINPGDAGTPTQITLKAPGFHFSDIHWPAPQWIPVGDFKSFGYEDEVLHLIRVQPPKELEAGTTITITGDAEWLVCKEICLEGKANLSLRLPVAGEHKHINAAMFDKWLLSRPVDPRAKPASETIAGIKQLTDSKGGPRNAFEVTWKTAAPPKDVTWFPIATDAVGIDKVKLSHARNVTQIAYEADIYDAEKIADGIVNGVLTYKDGEGKRVAVQTAVRVQLPKK